MTTRTPSRTSVGQSATVLALGTLLAAALWWVGQAERAWLGYLVAAMTWPLWTPARERPATGARPAPGASREVRTAAHGTPVRLADLPDGVYDLLPGASQVTVRARKLRLFGVAARVEPPSGAVVLSGGEVTAELDVVAATFDSGNPRRDVHVLGPDFLDARNHPSLRFATGRAPLGVQPPAADPAARVGDAADPAGLRSSGDGPLVQVPGRLEVRGQQVPTVWTVTELAHDPVTGEVWGRATTSVRRSEFGMRTLLWLAGDEVGIDVVVAARRRLTR